MQIFNEWTALAALAVVVIQQILKLNVIPVFFANQYPVLTNIILSIVASVVVNYKGLAGLHDVWSWVVEVFVISVVAAITYNSTLRNSAAVQRASNPQ